MPKNTNKTKNTGTNFDLKTVSLIEIYQTISKKFKIGVSQLIAKILLKQLKLKSNQIVLDMTYSNLTFFFFFFFF